jgi:Mn-dependent DtxR family transcriptional regulator
MTYWGSSGQFANLGYSHSRKGKLTRCAEILKLCYEGPQNISRLAATLGMQQTKVAECLTKMRKRGLMQEGWGVCKPTEAGRAEAERRWGQQQRRAG